MEIELEKNKNIASAIKFLNYLIALGLLLTFIPPFMQYAQTKPTIYIDSISTILILSVILIFHYWIKKTSLSISILEVVIDTIIITPVIYTTGGVESPFFLLYLGLLFEELIIDKNYIIPVILNMIIITEGIIHILLMPHSSVDWIIFSVEVVAQISIVFVSKTRFNLSSRVEKNYLVAKEETQKIEKENIQKDEFISMASHELRSPITALRGYLQILTLEKDFETLPKDTKDDLAILSNETDRLNRLIENILNISRIELKRLVINKTPTDIEQVIYKVVNQLNKQKIDRNVNIEVEKNTEETKVNTDPDKLYEVLFNLVDNAIKFSNEGGNIKISVQKEGNIHTVKVIDHGIGIPEKDLPHIFEKFYRVSNNTQNTDDGLGLYLSLNFINLIGGGLKIDSKENEGTTATVTI